MVEKRGNVIRNSSLLTLACLSFVGCSSMPAPGEGKEKYTVGFPRHPAMMAIQAGNYEIRKTGTSGEVSTFEIVGNHWMFGERGRCEIGLPRDAKNVGYDVTQGLLDNSFWIGYDLEEEGKTQRFVREYKVGMGAGKAKLEDEFPVDWNEDRQKYIKKK